ncbi:hypothetical protein LZ017_06895 [Pelomonas sp. CA6]|uniref:hypothetical protein n=1 Tax=Pelomonas sp. CA6 TaxID=2907999 RepID=UPI001F4C2023|nr:hypothetical protein [Pelomonas sp. CA6]MCH7343105.1 hypothetical protein [Pelomonas sp. CA6]
MRLLTRPLTPPLTLLTLLGAGLAQAQGSSTPATPTATATDVRPAALEMNWTPLKLPNGARAAMLGGSYMVALDEDWGLGPAVYGVAKGSYGGLFTAGVNLQRRWRLGAQTHLAASFYAGAGGGVSSEQVRPGGGFMIRPELSLRTEFNQWYAGVGVAQVRFPSGNIRDTTWALTLGRTDRFLSFSPAESGRPARAGDRTGMGFDEIALSAGLEKPRASRSRTRAGDVLSGRKGKAGADLRQYFGNGSSWWGIEASGAAQGGHDGYMEILANAGQDWPLFSERVRVGGQLSVGLGGGGDLDTGSGWLLRAGPTLRWITPWGPTLRLDAGFMKAPRGHYESSQVRLSLALPLEAASRSLSEPPLESGKVRVQQWYLSLPHFRKMLFKDGSQESVTGLALGMTREFGGPLYGVAQAGSAAFGKAGAYSFGMFGLGLQGPRWSGWRVGAEALAGAAGGGGVAVGSGAAAQAEAWLQWEGRSASDRLRVRVGAGQWRALGGEKHSTPMVNLSLGYAFGALGQ